MSTEILISTTPSIPGYKIVRSLGIVHGMTARTRGLAGKILGGLQSIAGGEVTAFTLELTKANDEALERLKVSAKSTGANGVVGVDFETTEVSETVVLVSAHGAAVVIEVE